MIRSTFSTTALFAVVVALFSSFARADTATASSTVDSIFDSTTGLAIGGSILAAVAVIVGGVMVVLGYRLIRATLFAIGFVAGGVGIAIIVENMFVNKSWVAIASWVALVLGGCICGGISSWLHPASIFVAGAATGVMIAMILTNSVGYMLYPGHTHDVFTLSSVVFGILFGALTVKFEKPALIVTTSLFGAGILAWGVGYFAGDFPSTTDLEKYATEDLNGDLVYSIPTAWWAYLGGIVVVSAFGMLIQFWKTARNVTEDKTDALGHRVEAAAPYVETQKSQRSRRSDILTMDGPHALSRRSENSMAYTIAANQPFCRLYSRDTESYSNQVKTFPPQARPYTVESLESREEEF
ncbi:hypothetical protein BBJ28_00009625 [Nothophytophthora sp. Chile5]|nr:hypothetical protein BBJ28_00009625 [Nothophytophthora sp. Chile5]